MLGVRTGVSHGPHRLHYFGYPLEAYRGKAAGGDTIGIYITRLQFARVIEPFANFSAPARKMSPNIFSPSVGTNMPHTLFSPAPDIGALTNFALRHATKDTSTGSTLFQIPHQNVAESQKRYTVIMSNAGSDLTTVQFCGGRYRIDRGSQEFTVQYCSTFESFSYGTQS